MSRDVATLLACLVLLPTVATLMAYLSIRDEAHEQRDGDRWLRPHVIRDLEHELLDPPYHHDNECYRCHPDTTALRVNPSIVKRIRR